jgi:hypothetical protein
MSPAAFRIPRSKQSSKASQFQDFAAMRIERIISVRSSGWGCYVDMLAMTADWRYPLIQC